jgi:arginyl-tRNA synthetase
VFFTKNRRAIRSIWQFQLRSALHACQIPADSSRIPINRSRNALHVAYRSAIALQLSPQLARSPMDLAQEIVAQLSDQSDFAISISPSGWIDCQLTDVGLAQGLQHWISCPMELPTHTLLSPPPVKGFPVQYAHARCCALLRLADREGLIVLQSSETDVNIVAPDPFPWLDATRSLYLQHPAERSLISQLVAVVDALEDPASQNEGKLAIQLSEAFERFYSQCSIFGDVKTANPPLVIGRSGLVGATQKVLKCLLDNKFGISSPMEL